MAKTVKKSDPRPFAPKDTPEVRAKFLDGLREGLTPKRAAEAAGVGRTTVFTWRRTDTVFAQQWEDAYDEGTDLLEEEAQRRAVQGVSRPVYQGGELVGHVQEYSDTLMNIMLQARRPAKFRKGIELTGPEGGPLKADLTVTFVEGAAPAKAGLR